MKRARWSFNNVFEYWDQLKDAVYKNSRILSKLKDRESAEALAEMKYCIKSHGKNFTDEELVKFAWVMSEDLYKAANRPVIAFDKALSQYLESTASTFCSLLKDRGFLIHYLIDNTYGQTPSGMERPLKLFPVWFRTAGMIYVCPQHIALQMLEQKEHDESYFIELPRCINEARNLAEEIVKRCHHSRLHYVYLDTDWKPDSFKCSESVKNDPGIITIFRNEAPLPQSNSGISCCNRNGKSLV